MKTKPPKTIDRPVHQLHGAGVRQNMRRTRQALARKRRDAEERAEREGYFA